MFQSHPTEAFTERIDWEGTNNFQVFVVSKKKKLHWSQIESEMYENISGFFELKWERIQK